MEAHATATLDSMYDRVKQALMLETDRAHVLREMIYVCRPAGMISVPGVYGGLIDKIPFGAAMNKGLTFRMGQTHVNRWSDDLLRRIEEGQIDPSFVITHTVGAGAGAGDVQDVPRQAGRLHQGRDQALKESKPCATKAKGRAGAATRIPPPTRSPGASAGSRSGSALVELAAPALPRAALGMEGSEGLIQAYGAREIATGIAILASRRSRRPGSGARVAGDALDLATLATGLEGDNPQEGNVMLAMAAVARRHRARRLLRHDADRREPAPAAAACATTAARSACPARPGAMRGAARDFEVPPDFRTPEALRPWTAA